MQQTHTHTQTHSAQTEQLQSNWDVRCIMYEMHYAINLFRTVNFIANAFIVSVFICNITYIAVLIVLYFEIEFRG